MDVTDVAVTELASMAAPYNPRRISDRDLDDPSEKQLNLALNRIHGEWDTEKLEELLAQLKVDGADLQLTGFSDDELAALLVDQEVLQEGLTDPDAIPEPPDEPATKRGDLIILGQHRLLCGDAGAGTDLERLLAGNPIHLIHMDPPYNVNVEPRSNNAIAAAGRNRTHHQGFDLARKADGEDACPRPRSGERLPAAGGIREAPARVVHERRLRT